MIVKCSQCSKEFNKFPSEVKKTTNNFCSRSCAASFNNRLSPKRKIIPRICKKCHAPFQHLGKHNVLCLKCRAIPLRTKGMTIGDYIHLPALQNRHPSWRYAYIRNLNRTWNKTLMQLPCQKCGYGNHIELAHIKPIGAFSEDTLLEIVNSPKNILVLCPNHHWEFDNGLLSLQDIPIRMTDSES